MAQRVAGIAGAAGSRTANSHSAIPARRHHRSTSAHWTGACSSTRCGRRRATPSSAVCSSALWRRTAACARSRRSLWPWRVAPGTQRSAAACCSGCDCNFLGRAPSREPGSGSAKRLPMDALRPNSAERAAKASSVCRVGAGQGGPTVGVQSGLARRVEPTCQPASQLGSQPTIEPARAPQEAKHAAGETSNHAAHSQRCQGR